MKTTAASAIAKLAELTPRRLRQLAEAGHIPKPVKGQYPTGQTIAALIRYYRDHAGSDLKRNRLMQQTRRDKAQADILELERSQRQKDLITMTEAEEVVRSYLMPVRDLILSAPAVLAPRVNPSDPELARLQLEEWVEDGLKRVREVGASEEKAQNAAA